MLDVKETFKTFKNSIKTHLCPRLSFAPEGEGGGCSTKLGVDEVLVG
jgi:hypothetical protein